MGWKEKNVFITGASSGIGAALALEFAKRGAKLGLLARRAEKLAEVNNSALQFTDTVLCFSVDVSDESSVNAAIDEFTSQFGTIDLLISNAGIGMPGKIQKLSTKELKDLFDVNFFGAVYPALAALPKMIERGSGHIVVISSLAGSRGLPGSASYSASKAAINNFFESARLDLIDTGIDVTIIQPGFIKTPLTADRSANMPFLMELEDAVPLFMKAIEKRKKYAAFPWQLSVIVKLARIFPASLYDAIAGRRNLRE